MAYGKSRNLWRAVWFFSLIFVGCFCFITVQQSKAQDQVVAQDLVAPSHSAATVTITQVNYANVDAAHFVIRINKQIGYGILLGLGILSVVIVVFLCLAALRKKRDPVLTRLYEQLRSAQTANEVYDLLNTMLKHCYKVSIKASSQGMILNALPTGALSEQIVEIMDYMEADGEKSQACLKKKAQAVYKLLLHNK